MFLRVLETRKFKIKVRTTVGLWWGTSSCLAGRCLLAASFQGGEWALASLPLWIRTLIPTWESHHLTSFKTNYLLKAPLLNMVTFWVSTYKSWGDTDMQFRTHTSSFSVSHNPSFFSTINYSACCQWLDIHLHRFIPEFAKYWPTTTGYLNLL